MSADFDGYLIPDLDPEVLEYFLPEAQEYLETITLSMLRLEKDPEDAETIQQLFRAAHTLKGSAYTIGFQAIGDVTHHVENFVGAIRDRKMRATPELTDLIFRAVDGVRLLLRRDPDALESTRQEFDALMERLCRAESEAEGQAPAPSEPTEAVKGREEGRQPGVPARERVEGAVIRVSQERLERLLNLAGEVVIGRSQLDQRLAALEDLSRQVLIYNDRMNESVRTFGEMHAFSPPAPTQGRPGLDASSVLTNFGALEFDRYDDLNVFTRHMGEVAADVGEAVAQLNASISKTREDMDLLRQLTLDLRNEIVRTRMIPIGTLFNRFQKTVRELARATGKNITVTVSGASTEIDTGVVQQLVDPLIHILRNAVAHGIETPDVRRARGKPDTGTVSLHATHHGNAVVIEVEDDGAGLDVEKIKAKAVAHGTLSPEQAAVMPSAEALKLIYLPGLTTADEVGEQAGRGVGMDVVKRAIETMHGGIRVATNEGVGTKFTLTLPLTLFVSPVLIVRVGDHRYALPFSGIREVLVPPAGAVRNIDGRLVLQGDGETLEVKPLARLLGAESAGSNGPAPVVVIRTARGTLGVSVDDVLGQQEIVIKTLGSLKLFQGSCYSGATIDGEGRVVLVVDAEGLLAASRRSDRALPTPVSSRASTSPGGEEETRILLIDDSLTVRKFVTRVLESAGYHVETAADGEEGLRKALAETYRLIITDLELPKRNGFEVIRALRDQPHTQSTPIIVMTTRAGEKHRRIALGLGATAYLTKPVEENALLLEVKDRIGGTARART
jgi:chemosensory pili system protein ChpA (sensor histidine kinase/response regulator)